MTILLVEDQKEIRSIWKQFLNPIEAEIREAESIDEAYYLMQLLPNPDLVLLDLGLPGSGPEITLNQIKTLKEINPKAVVIVITGRISEHLPALAMRMGADAFRNKMELKTQVELFRTIKQAANSTARNFQDNIQLFQRVSELCA